MIETFKGIIYKTQDYGETSKLLYIITEDKIISVLAKGCKSVKSNLRSCTDKLCYGNFNIYYKKDKLSILSSVDIINNYKEIKKDITKISYASYLLELSSQVIKQNNNKEVFEILIEGLDKINLGFDPLVIMNIIELKYLSYLGVNPSLDGCVKCGSKVIKTLSSYLGGYVCEKCYTNEEIVSEKTIKLIRMLYYVDISKISKMDVSDISKKEVNRFLTNYYDRYTGLYLNSKNFINNLNKLNELVKK